MSQLLSIETPAVLSLKDWAKIKAGQSLACIFKERACHLQNHPTNYASRIWDRLIMAFLRERARLRNDSLFFESIHREFWTGSGGEVFASNCDHRFEDIFLNLQKEEFTQLMEAWGSGQFKHIVEIGCSSGLLTQFLTTSLDGVDTAIGIDLNKAQIDLNRGNKDFDSRIRFLNTDGFEYVCSNSRNSCLFVTNGGVLEYFSRSQLDRMLSHLSGEIGNCLFFAIEPIAPDHDWLSTTESVPFGEELSYSHNYVDAFESNGFKILHQRHVDFESWRWMATIARTEDA